jgi:hypothetical protein
MTQTVTDKNRTSPASATNPCRPVVACAVLSASIRRAKRFRAAALAVLGLAVLPAYALPTNYTYTVEGTVKETYDDNVYLQNNAPPSTMSDAVPAKKDSLVTTITPHVALSDQLCSGFKMSLSYAPDVAIYHNAPSEDNTTHRGVATFSGAAGDDVVWEQANAFTYIDGSRYGPIFGRVTPGPSQDVPAIGGIPLRDRRAAFIYRGGFKLTWTLDRFFIRPVASAYVHDFKTVQEPEPTPTGAYYENYVSRQDVNGGMDIGYDVGKKTYLTLGYRYGQQDQGDLLGERSPYNSKYHRVLAGVEGSPVKWLKLNVQLGPEFRRFDPISNPTLAAEFNRNELLCYADASATIIPTKADTVSLRWTRFEQPAFSSQSVYEDIKYDLTWRHKFCDQFTAGAGFTVYVGDWQTPVNRNDWIYTPSLMASYNFNKHLSAEANWSCDWAQSKVSTSAEGAEYADGREFTRNLVSLAVKYAF